MLTSIALGTLLALLPGSSQEDEPGPPQKGKAGKPAAKAEPGQNEPNQNKPKGQGGGKDPSGEPRPRAEKKAGDSGDGKKPATPTGAPVPAPRPLPQLKTPAATEKLKEGLKKLEQRDYSEARIVFNAVLKDAAGPNDRKLLMGLIDDTKLGAEIEAARSMVEKKDERKALTRIEKALRTYPDSALRPEAEKLIKETEEVIFLILDDFEPGEGLDKETAGREGTPDKQDAKKALTETSRWKKNMAYNSDPHFVKHGKGSMKWRIGGDYYGGYRYWYDGYSYTSTELKNPITKWRQLVFWYFCPDADEGTLRVTLTPDMDRGVVGSLYSKKLIDMRGKRGWTEVRLNLNSDFGNTKVINLEDIHFIRIENLGVKYRTIYLDFIHLE